MKHESTPRYRFDPRSREGLNKLGRIPLSKHFHMREFLYSETAIYEGIPNVPDDVEAAVRAGSELCQRLLEPLQDRFGRIHIRSGYRSRAVNKAGIGRGCAADNDGAHTWDFPSKNHGIGAMACISIPRISQKILASEAEYQAIAWWIVDHLPDWSAIEFFAPPNYDFANEVSFNIGWHERPMRSIKSYWGPQRNLSDNIPDPSSRKLLWEKLLA